jgi:small subunit ribosomal protein S5
MDYLKPCKSPIIYLGHSVRAHHVIYDICQALGIQDLGAKITQGSTNPVTIARSMFYALRCLHKTPNHVSTVRGRPLQEVRSQHAGQSIV